MGYPRVGDSGLDICDLVPQVVEPDTPVQGLGLDCLLPQEVNVHVRLLLPVLSLTPCWELGDDHWAGSEVEVVWDCWLEVNVAWVWRLGLESWWRGLLEVVCGLEVWGWGRNETWWGSLG